MNLSWDLPILLDVLEWNSVTETYLSITFLINLCLPNYIWLIYRNKQKIGIFINDEIEHQNLQINNKCSSNWAEEKPL